MRRAGYAQGQDRGGGGRAGRSGEVRFQGEIANRPRPCGSCSSGSRRSTAGSGCATRPARCGYGLYRQIAALGHDCTVVAPSLIPTQARRAGQDQPARRGHAGPAASRRRADRGWVPDAAHEAMRDLVRARDGRGGGAAAGPPAAAGLPAAPRPGLHAAAGPWTHGPSALAGRAELRASRPADRPAGVARGDRRAERRCERLGAADRGSCRAGRMAPVVAALQAMRGVAS